MSSSSPQQDLFYASLTNLLDSLNLIIRIFFLGAIVYRIGSRPGETVRVFKGFWIFVALLLLDFIEVLQGVHAELLSRSWDTSESGPAEEWFARLRVAKAMNEFAGAFH